MRFFVGQDRERSIVNLRDQIDSHRDLVPPGVAGWVVKPVQIDDVPVITLTFHSATRDAYQLRRIAEEAKVRLESLPDLSRSEIFGGLAREITVEPELEALASPGNIVLRLFDPARVMLDVPVREGLVTRIRLDEKVIFYVDALRTNLTGEVREIVPSVDPGSRTFLVKVCISNAPALMPGMFGVLELNTGTRAALLVPAACVTRVGQLEYVRTVIDKRLRQVLVRTIPAESGMCEVVSGLSAGMRLARP